MPRANPTIIGAGLVALDVVLTRTGSSPPRFWAGGTCGNVLAILGFLDWRPVAVGRLRPDSAGQRVVEDLKRWNVDMRYACVEPRCSTPIVVEEIFHARTGVLRHRYLWTCPDCGAYLPSFRPVTIRVARDLKESLQTPSVFFFDRVSPGILELARHFSRQGALIFFEPSAEGDARQVREALQLCHVLKYSHQRVRGVVDLLPDCSALLHIETMGEDGLRYRVRKGGRTGSWRQVPAFDVSEFRDAAGAGDWCSAGIAAKICTGGPDALREKTDVEIRAAVRFGQALAAWNCMFEGPRGGMYQTDVFGFRRAIKTILVGTNDSELLAQSKTNGGQNATLDSLCPSCDATSHARARQSVG